MTINRMVVFGDSLQDNGNLIKTLNIPGKPFDGGRFSNGKVACEYLLNFISESQKTTISIDNFAVGGAYTSGKNPKSLLTNHSICVSHQIDRFVAKHIRFNDDDIVILNGGGNNFLFALHDEKPYFNFMAIHKVAADLLLSIDRIVKLGAKMVMVSNLPDVTTVPAYDVAGFPLWIVSPLKKYLKHNLLKQNLKLSQGLKELQFKYQDVNLCLFDVFSLFINILSNPLKYGFENTSDVCVESFGGVDAKGNIQTDIDIVADYNTHLFWDYVHPTTKAHKIIAEHMYNSIFTS